MTYKNASYYQYFNFSKCAFKYGDLKGISHQLLNIKRGANGVSKKMSWRSFFIIEKELERS